MIFAIAEPFLRPKECLKQTCDQAAKNIRQPSVFPTGGRLQCGAVSFAFDHGRDSGCGASRPAEDRN